MANGDAKSLGDALLKFTADTEDAADQIVRIVGRYVIGKVTEMSPVGQPGIWKVNVGKPRDKWQRPPGYVGGRFKGNWQVTIGKPAEGVLPNVDPGGQATILAGTATMENAVRPREVWFTNNLPYSEEIESGHSTQAPVGVVAVTMAGISGALDQAATQALNEKGLA